MHADDEHHSDETAFTARFAFLSGMMGSGKSTVGRRLADAIGGSFVDLDRYIEAERGSIADLFARGESEFRRHESECLRELVETRRDMVGWQIVALGGGAVARPNNRALMAAHGALIYLRVSVAELARRLASPEQRDERPLLHGIGEARSGAAARELQRRLEGLLADRRSSYEACPIHVDADVDAAEVVRRILQRLEPLTEAQS